MSRSTKAWHHHARCKAPQAEGFRGRDAWCRHMAQVYWSAAFEARFAGAFATRAKRQLAETASTLRELGGIEPVRLQLDERHGPGEDEP